MHSKYVPNENSSRERKLGYLVEECGEVLQAAGKSIRWGDSSFNPDIPPEQRETNRDWLLREIADLRYALDLISPPDSAAPPADGEDRFIAGWRECREAAARAVMKMQRATGRSFTAASEYCDAIRALPEPEQQARAAESGK